MGTEHLEGTVLLDVANPLDFSAGFRATLSVKDTDSLAEQLQRAFPGARVVKSLNTVTASVMVDPGSVGDGEHHRVRGRRRRRGRAASCTACSPTSAGAM